MSDPEKNFVRETISGQKRWNTKLWKRFALCLCLAVVFGVVSSLTFCITRNRWENKHGEPTTDERVTVFQDETTQETAAVTTEPESETEESVSEGDGGSWNAIKPKVQRMLENYKTDMEDLTDLYSVKKKLADQVSKSMVSVTAKQENVDWFDNVVSSQSESCGVIIAQTAKDYLILTDAAILEESDSLRVTFYNGGWADAEIRGIDSLYGIAVIAAPAADVENGIEDGYPVIPLGTGTSLAGSFAAIAGRPYGRGYATAFGTIATVYVDVSSVDSLVRLYQTDIDGADGSCGILVNSAGEMTGWVTSKYGSSTASGLLSCIALSDLKASIEKLSNGNRMASLGIRGKNVTTSISEEYDIPTGIYITKCAADRPAGQAGLQSGDILTGLGTTEIFSFSDLTLALEKSEPGEVVDVTIMRSGRDGYREMRYSVELTAR